MTEEKIPGILKHVLEVIEIAICKDYVKSNVKYFDKIPIEIVAEREALWPTTIADECRRQIGLTAAEFRNLLRDPEELISHLIKVYPKYAETIISRLKK